MRDVLCSIIKLQDRVAVFISYSSDQIYRKCRPVAYIYTRVYQKFKLLISSQSSHIPSPPLRHPAAPRWTRSSCSRAPSQPSPPSPRSGMPPLAPLPAMDIIKRTFNHQKRILAFSVPFRTTPSFLTMDTSLRTLRRPIITGSTFAKKNQNKDKPFCNPHLLA